MAELIIAKQGGSVTDAEKDLAFTSNRACSIELLNNTVNITTDGSGYGTANITHGLGYIPQFFGFVRDPLATTEWYPINDGYMGCSVGADTSKLYFTIDYKEPSVTYVVRYSVFANRLDNGTGSGNSNVSGKCRIAKSGYKADTETDARNMQFFSGASVYKVDDTLSGTTVMTVNDYINEKTIVHGLGYVPVVFVLNSASRGISDNGQMLPNGFDLMSYSITSTSFTIYYEDLLWSYGDPTYEMEFKYKILRDKIA